MARSSIEWTEATWNPVTGCDKISPGCKHCYAEVMARRLRAMGQPNYRDGFKLTLHPAMLDRPLCWRRSQMIFVNSMSDLFHNDVPLAFIQRVFDVMNRASWHTFQVLTKRAERLEALAPLVAWPDNVWMRVSVERADYTSRIEHLLRTPARVKFLSLEPLLGPLSKIDLRGIDWVIVGGESGSAARPMEEGWYSAPSSSPAPPPETVVIPVGSLSPTDQWMPLPKVADRAPPEAELLHPAHADRRASGEAVSDDGPALIAATFPCSSRRRARGHSRR